MKTQKFMYVVILLIATLFFTSCEAPYLKELFHKRYRLGQPLDDNNITQPVVWKSMMSDSIRKEMIRYFNLIGENNHPDVSDMLLQKQLGIFNVPDEMIKDMPWYYDCFYLNQKMVFEREVHRTSSPTFWEPPKATFTLKVMNPEDFDQAEIIIVTEDVRVVWQFIVACAFVVLLILSWLIWFSSLSSKSGDAWLSALLAICFFLCAVGVLVWLWIYAAYFLSGFCTLALITWLFFLLRRIYYPS